MMTKEIFSVQNGMRMSVLHVPSELTSTTTEDASPSLLHAKTSITKAMSVSDATKDMKSTTITNVS